MITVALQLTSASGFLDRYSIDRRQRVEDDLVIDVLLSFYKDLFDVGGIRGAGEITRSHEGCIEDHLKHGLSALKAINAFNIAVDDWYKIRKSPNFRLLLDTHNSFKDQMAPLEQVTAEISKMKATIAPYLPDDEGGRVGPTMLVFSDSRPLGRETVESILYEYAQKLRITGISTNRTPGESSSSSQQPRSTNCNIASLLCNSSNRARESHYSNILDQLNSFDPNFAKMIKRGAVNYIDKDMPKALNNVEKMSKQLENTDFCSGSFAKWFKIELTRRSEDRCDQNSLTMMQQEADAIEFMRRKSPGVSIGQMLELRAKVVFRLMICFHRNVNIRQD